MNADTDAFTAIREQVVRHDATLGALDLLMREVIRSSGLLGHVSPPALTVVPGGAPAGRRSRPRGRLRAVADATMTGPTAADDDRETT